MQNRRPVLRIMAAGVLIAGAVFSVSPAAAAEVEVCLSLFSKVDVAIAACTQAIDSGRYSAQDAAALHASRGIAYSAMRLRDRAGEDFDRTMQLDPRFAQGDRANPVDVGDGRFVFCCRALVYDRRDNVIWELRDSRGNVDLERCIQACWTNLSSQSAR